ncbi:rod shape-determining protein MreD [Myroides sp. LJL116]
MNSIVLSNIVRFTCLLLAQVLIFNNIDLFTFINPYPYILFIILYPVNGNKALFYISSFLLGLCIDTFENSGGVQAAASLILAFARPSILKFSFGISYEYHNLNIFRKVTSDLFKSLEVFGYLAICILVHHVVLFTLEFLRFDFLLELGLRIVLTTVATLLTCILILFLMKPVRK